MLTDTPAYIRTVTRHQRRGLAGVLPVRAEDIPSQTCHERVWKDSALIVFESVVENILNHQAYFMFVHSVTIIETS